MGFTVDLPIIGQTYKPVTILAVDNDFIMIYSCELRGSRRIKKAMVIISSLSKPSQSLDQRIRQAFADYGVKMPEMNTNDLEDCSKINSNDSVQLPETPQTSEEPSLACFFSLSCITAKVHEIVSSFLP